jgi:hypothetical protein
MDSDLKKFISERDWLNESINNTRDLLKYERNEVIKMENERRNDSQWIEILNDRLENIESLKKDLNLYQDLLMKLVKNE